MARPVETLPAVPRVDWSTWRPVEEATLLFVVPGDGRVLLIHKKRGMGAGLINAPGGRIEPGERPLQAAVRETLEELCIRAHRPRFAGRLHFHDTSGYRLRVFVFRASDYEGEPRETDEARPEWFAEDSLPYDRMWADDAVWVPWLLRGESFDGRFVFDGPMMLWHHVDVPRACCRVPAGEPPCKS